MEIQRGNGRIQRVKFYVCAECKAEVPALHRRQADLCLDCGGRIEKAERTLANAILEAQYGAKWALERQVRAAELAKIATEKRAFRLKAATPYWVRKEEILEIYEECRRRSAAEGVDYHVDHVWPIAHPDCCGLHVPWNLQIIPATENLKKNNKLVDGRAGGKLRA